jgi:hypothetical protein
MPIKTKEGKNEIHGHRIDHPFADQYCNKKRRKGRKAGSEKERGEGSCRVLLKIKCAEGGNYSSPLAAGYFS